MTDKLNCYVQSCFEIFKFVLEIFIFEELGNFHAFRLKSAPFPLREKARLLQSVVF